MSNTGEHLLALDELTKQLTVRVIRRQRIENEITGKVAALKAKHQDELAGINADIAKIIADIRKILNESWSSIFVKRSVKLLYGILSVRTVTQKSAPDLDQLLALARRLGIVRTIFKPKVVYELRPDALEELQRHRPELVGAVIEWFGEPEVVDSVAFKPDLTARDIGTEQLSGKSIPLGKFPAHKKS